jgi:L-2-hydroxyglutarate oxidase
MVYDFIIIGGGVIGLSVAAKLSKYNVLVLEKEANVAKHQTGRNSGVIHSGIYYKPGSIKAETCRRGKIMLEEWCQKHDVPIRKCGKVIVATSNQQFDRLDAILERGKQNGINCDMISLDKLKELEPYCNGKRAVHVPETGIVSFKEICYKLAKYTKIQIFREVLFVHQNSIGSSIVTDKGIYSAKHVINCAGLYADTIAERSGVKTNMKIIPFRGKYYTLREEAKHLCKTLIYPVPDPRFPFLGVHFTSMIDGGVEVGPNAVLALGKEAYDWKSINVKEIIDTLKYKGAIKLFKKHWRMGLREMLMSVSKTQYLKELRKLVPSVKYEDLLPRVSGIRAQAVDIDGNLVDDFRLVHDNKVLHVLNAPSPAATAALAIADKITANFT